MKQSVALKVYPREARSGGVVRGAGQGFTRTCEVECLSIPEAFYAAGLFHQFFPHVSDEGMIASLASDLAGNASILLTTTFKENFQ